MKRVVTLIYNGAQIRDRGEFLNLTDMWKAAASPSGRSPSDWLSLESAKEFVAHVAATLPENAGNPGIIEAIRGRNGGTMAHWQIGMAYAKYLSPEFHMWCNSVVRAHMEGQTVAGIHAIRAALVKVQQWNTAYRMLGRINQIAGQKAAAQAMPAILAELGIHVDTSDSPVMRQGDLPLGGR